MALQQADRMEIAELVARFCHFSDYGDWAALETCFTEDVVTCIDGTPQYVGVAAQVGHARNSADWTDGQNRHVALNLWIEPDGEVAARAHYYLLNFVCGRAIGEARIVVSARMTDHVVRSAGGWRIARRELVPDQPFPVPDGSAR